MTTALGVAATWRRKSSYWGSRPMLPVERWIGFTVRWMRIPESLHSTKKRGVLAATAPDPEPPAPPPPGPAAEGLIAPTVAASAAAAVGQLLRTVAAERGAAVSRGGPTIEDLVREELRPLLREWLNQHLPPLVERLVRAEIERVVGRALS